MTVTIAPYSPPPELIERVMDLPADQRKELGHLLLDSVEDRIDTDDEWHSKIRSRIESYLANPTHVYKGEEVIAEMREMLRLRRERAS